MINRYPLLLATALVCLLFLAVHTSPGAEEKTSGAVRYKLTSIMITGKPLFSVGRVARAMGVKRGSSVSPSEMEILKGRIRNFYRRKGHYEAEIGQPRLIPGRAGRAWLTVQINAGPRITIEFPGQGIFASRKLREVSGLTQRSIFIESILKSAERRIEGYYRSKGYYFARARHRVETDAARNSKVIIYRVSKGSRQRVKKIAIEGNRLFTDRRVKKVMKTKEQGIFRRGIFREQVLKEDPPRMESFYLERGYLDVKVAPPRVRFDRRKEKVFVTVGLEEGKLYRYGGADMSGFSFLRGAKAEGMLGFEPGEELNLSKAERGIEKIRAYYLDRGFLDVELSSDLVKREEGDEVDVRLDVNEGPQYRVGGISIRGNDKTRERFIRRKVALEQDAVYSQRKVQSTVKELRATGLFSTIKVQPRRREGAEDVMDVVLNLEENRPGLVEVGVGYSSEEDFKGHFRAEYRNLGGMARRIEGLVKGSGLGLESELSYTDPFLLGRELSGRARARYGELDEEFFKVRKIENIYSIRKTFRRIYGFELAYSLEFADFFDVESVAVMESHQEETRRVAFLNPAITRDTRDNTADPRRGMFTSLSLEAAPRFLGSEVEFYRVLARQVVYHTLFGDVVLALNTKAGFGDVFGETVILPLDKRFFLGGTDSVRGFDRNAIGPLDGLGSVVGGDVSLSYNLEVRFPLAGKLFGAVFTDGGISRLLDPLPGIHNTPFRFSAGAGLRYATPVGFLKLDLGIKLNRLRGEDLSRVHFLIGRAF